MLDNLFQSVNYEATKALMDVAAERHKVLASNLANAETPGYRRMELDPSFDKALKLSLKGGEIKSIAAADIPFREDRDPKFRVDHTGNNVSEDQELMLINENALRYEALGQFASSSLQQLRTAITGRIT
jgi:flagellar basal-body rod protein FlgB